MLPSSIPLRLRRCRAAWLLGAAVLLSGTLCFAGTIRSTLMWGGEGSEDGKFRHIKAIAASPTGDIYVVNNYPGVFSRVQMFNTHGAFVKTIGTSGTARGQFSSPEGIAVDRVTGSVFVADTLNNRIQKFSRHGHLEHVWGGIGTGNEHFQSPIAVAVGPDHSVYVIDRGNVRIMRFDAHGNYLAKWKVVNPSGIGGASPTGIAVGPGNEVYVVNSGSRQILKYDSSGRLLRSWHTHHFAKDPSAYPVSIAVNPIGLVFVSCAIDQHIQVFTGDGEYIKSFQVSSRNPTSGNYEIYPPGPMAFTNDETLFVVHYVPSRISKVEGVLAGGF